MRALAGARGRGAISRSSHLGVLWALFGWRVELLGLAVIVGLSGCSPASSVNWLRSALHPGFVLTASD
jgi:hypothetical protein